MTCRECRMSRGTRTTTATWPWPLLKAAEDGPPACRTVKPPDLPLQSHARFQTAPAPARRSCHPLRSLLGPPAASQRTTLPSGTRTANACPPLRPPSAPPFLPLLPGASPCRCHRSRTRHRSPATPGPPRPRRNTSTRTLMLRPPTSCRVGPEVWTFRAPLRACITPPSPTRPRLTPRLLLAPAP